MRGLGRKVAQRNAHHVGDVTEHPRSVKTPPGRSRFRPDSVQTLEYQTPGTAVHQSFDVHSPWTSNGSPLSSGRI